MCLFGMWVSAAGRGAASRGGPAARPASCAAAERGRQECTPLRERIGVVNTASGRVRLGAARSGPERAGAARSSSGRFGVTNTAPDETRTIR